MLGRGRPVSVLNLFAYTGTAATVAARVCGRVGSCHVDAQRHGGVERTENASASKVSDKPIRWINVLRDNLWNAEIRRGRRYDAIIMEPPFLRRGTSARSWKLEEGLWPCVSCGWGALSDDPLVRHNKSYTSGLSPTRCSLT
jgi:23S rRNA (cytosine1962-C5)-methyltransferase